MSLPITNDFNKAMAEYIWLDMQALYDLSEEEYKEYIKSTFFVDHHDDLRLQRGKDGAPGLATTLEQLNVLISYLEFSREKMVSKAEWKLLVSKFI